MADRRDRRDDDQRVELYGRALADRGHLSIGEVSMNGRKPDLFSACPDRHFFPIRIWRQRLLSSRTGPGWRAPRAINRFLPTSYTARPRRTLWMKRFARILVESSRISAISVIGAAVVGAFSKRAARLVRDAKMVGLELDKDNISWRCQNLSMRRFSILVISAA
jgi:hypothetical protein